MKKVLILFVMAIAMNVTAQESVLLRLNYKSGDTYAVNMKNVSRCWNHDVYGYEHENVSNIVSVTGDNYVSKMKITFVGMDMSQGWNECKFGFNQK